MIIIQQKTIYYKSVQKNIACLVFECCIKTPISDARDMLLLNCTSCRSGKTLQDYFRYLFDEGRKHTGDSWQFQAEALSTPKLQIIMDHLADYFDLTNMREVVKGYKSTPFGNSLLMAI